MINHEEEGKIMAYSLDKSPGHLLRRAQQYAYDLYTKEVGATGPTPRQFAVLHTVSQNEGLSQTDLVRRTGIDRSTLADMISRLIKKGLLARERTKSDARANAVRITAAGKKVLNSALSSVTKSETGVLALLPKTQQAQFMKSLKSFADALDAMEAESAAPARKTKRAAAKKKAPAKKAAKKKAPAKKAARKTAAKKKAPAKRTKRVAAGRTTARRTTTTRRKTARR